MSEFMLSFVIAIALLAGLALWVPFSGFCNDCCQEILLRQRTRKVDAAPGTREGVALRELA